MDLVRKAEAQNYKCAEQSSIANHRKRMAALLRVVGCN
jgi:hypothetical protein